MFEQVFKVFQGGVIDRLDRKTSKRNQVEFVFYVDFFYKSYKRIKAMSEILKQKRHFKTCVVSFSLEL